MKTGYFPDIGVYIYVLGARASLCHIKALDVNINAFFYRSVHDYDVAIDTDNIAPGQRPRIYNPPL